MYLCKKADWDGLCNHMANFCDSSIEVSNCDPNLSVNQICDFFKAELNSIISKFIVTKVVKKRNGLPYVDGKIECLIKKTDKLHAQKDPTISRT